MLERSFGFAIALAVFIADQLTKWLVIGPLNLREVQQIYVVPIFNLTWTENYGISLGLFKASTDTGPWLPGPRTARVAAPPPAVAPPRPTPAAGAWSPCPAPSRSASRTGSGARSFAATRR